MFLFGHLLKLEGIAHSIIAVIAQAIEEDKWRGWGMRMDVDIPLLDSPQKSFSQPWSHSWAAQHWAPPHQVQVLCGLSLSHMLTCQPCHGRERVPLYLSWGTHISLGKCLSLPECCELLFSKAGNSHLGHSAVTACKIILVELVDCLHLCMEGMGGSQTFTWVSSCIQSCPNCTWPWGGARL